MDKCGTVSYLQKQKFFHYMKIWNRRFGSSPAQICLQSKPAPVSQNPWDNQEVSFLRLSIFVGLDIFSSFPLLLLFPMTCLQVIKITGLDNIQAINWLNCS